MGPFIKAIIISLIFIPKISHSQIKIDTLSSKTRNVFKETSTGKIVKNSVVDYQIEMTLLVDSNLVPQVILNNPRMKARALSIMRDASKKEDTILYSKAHVKIPLYVFWQGSKDTCDEYVWKNGIWSLESNKIFSTSGCFEDFFWLKFLGSIVVMLFAGRISFFSVMQHKESMIEHIIGLLFVGFFFPTFFIFYGSNFDSLNLLFTAHWLKIGIVNSVVGFTGGSIIWNLYPKQILKSPQSNLSNAYSKE